MNVGYFKCVAVSALAHLFLFLSICRCKRNPSVLSQATYSHCLFLVEGQSPLQLIAFVLLSPSRNWKSFCIQCTVCVFAQTLNTFLVSQKTRICSLPKIVHMQLAIPGCDDILAFLMVICSISRLLAVKRLQPNCQVIDVNSVETNSCTKVCSLWIYHEPCSSQQTLQNHQPTGYPFSHDVKGTLHPCGAIVFFKFCNHARYRSICLASICLCYMDFRVGIKHGNWKGKQLIASISVFFTALI